MKNFLLVLLSICVLQSCQVKSGSGNIERQDRKVSSFNAVSTGGGFEVEIKKGSSHKVIIEADDNVLEDIETEVSNGKLRVQYRTGVSINNADVKVYIETPELTGIHASAASQVKAEGVWNSAGKTMNLDASSAASIEIEIDAPATNLEASSSGKIVVKGRTKDLDTQASSGGVIEAGELLSENAGAQASSGASIVVHASIKLNAQASSGGSVNYRGEPAVSKQASSGGSINKSN